MGVAVALMRYHRGSFSRQSTLSAALVGAMSGGSGGGEEGEEEDSEKSAPEGSDPIVDDPWFQLVLCRECMLHGFYEAAQAGLRRLWGGGGERWRTGPVPTSDAVWVWTEVLGRVSAAETFFGGSSDPVRAEFTCSGTCLESTAPAPRC